MILKILLSGGLGLDGQPLVLSAAQVIVYHDNGTPAACAAEYGADHSLAVSMAGNEDFNRMLRNLGEQMTVICSTVKMPEPPKGARLIAGPKPHE